MDSDIVRYFLYHKNVLIHLELIITTKELDIFRFQYLQIAAYHKLSKRQSMPNDGFIYLVSMVCCKLFVGTKKVYSFQILQYTLTATNSISWTLHFKSHF